MFHTFKMQFIHLSPHVCTFCVVFVVVATLVVVVVLIALLAHCFQHFSFSVSFYHNVTFLLFFICFFPLNWRSPSHMFAVTVVILVPAMFSLIKKVFYHF